jgi:hypothetical protein
MVEFRLMLMPHGLTSYYIIRMESAFYGVCAGDDVTGDVE